MLTLVPLSTLYLNAGITKGAILIEKVGLIYQADGELIGTKSITIECGGVMFGKGTITSPNILIKTKVFDFRGTIETNGVCKIITSQPFDSAIFTRKGDGKFIFECQISCGTCGKEQRSQEHQLRRCSRCKNAWYCDEICQKNAWPIHKQICKPPAEKRKLQDMQQ